MSRRVPILLSLVAAAALVYAIGRQPVAYADSGAAAAMIAGSADDAVRAAVESAGDTYAGDCDLVISPRDIGRVCSRFVAERSGVQAYLTGRAFSEFTRWVFVAPAGTGGWRVAGSAPLDFFAPPQPPWPAGD